MEALTFMPNKSVLDSPICSSLGWHFPVSFIQLYAKQPITVLIISLLTKMVFERTDALVYHPLRFQVSILVFVLYATPSLPSFALYLLLIFNFSNSLMPVLGTGLSVSIFERVSYSSLISNSWMNIIKTQWERSV